MDGGQDLAPRRLAQTLLRFAGAQEPRVHQAGDEAGHERITRSHGVHQLNVQRVDNEHVALCGGLNVDAPGAARAQDPRRAGLRPLADDVLDGAARVEPLQILVGGLHDVREGHDRLDVGAGLVGRAQESRADVRVVGDGSADRLALDGGQDLVGTGLDDDHVGAGVNVSDGVRILDGRDVP